jgi:hypothetical protein
MDKDIRVKRDVEEGIENYCEAKSLRNIQMVQVECKGSSI